MQVAPPDDQILTNASCATWWPNMQHIQVAPSGGTFATNPSGAMWLQNLVQVTE